MIRFIITTDFDLMILKTRDENPLKFHIVELPQMSDNTVMVVCERFIADEIENELIGIGVGYDILGSWNRKGEFYDDAKESKKKEKSNINPKKAEHRFSVQRFKSKCKVKKDKDGNEIDEPIILNNIAGMGRVQIYTDEEIEIDVLNEVEETEKEKAEK